MGSTKNVLLGRSLRELEEWVVGHGYKPFRGRQLHEWLYSKGVKSLQEITVLPKHWRQTLLEEGFEVGRLREINRFTASDFTTKLLLETNDGENIEAVGIPTENRLTVCVSSQIGCPMACRFCATGKEGLNRSLQAYEIVSQVISVREVMGRRPSNVVFMGMGEPLLNIQEVLQSIRCINEDLGIGQRRITISTVGVPNTLPQLAEKAITFLGRAQFTLAVSLHAPNQQLREQIIPTASKYPLQSLLDDCSRYFSLTGRRVSFEYILLGGFNDNYEHAKELADQLSGFQSHINLIAYNPIGDDEFSRPTMQHINSFRNVLENRGLAVSFRASRGLDKNAACGQLRRQHFQSINGGAT